MRKWIALSLIGVLALSLLSGCGSSNRDSTETKSEGSKDGIVELTWMADSNPYKEKWLKNTIKDFETLHPNIKVNLITFPIADIPQKLQTMIPSGKVPDVWSANWGGGFATWKNKDLLLDLTPYVKRDPDVLKGIDPKLTEIYTMDGKVYGIPIFSYGTFLFYNKDLFDQANLPYPTTDWDDTNWNWEKMIEYAKALTVQSNNMNEKKYGILAALPLLDMAWLFGGDFYKAEDYVNGVMSDPIAASNPKNETALQKLVDLAHKEKVSPTQAQTEALEQMGDPFLAGKVAMIIGGGWNFQAYSQAATFRWGAAAVPYTEGRQVSIYVDPWNIYKGTKHPDEAWEFLKFISDPKGAGRAYADTTGVPPIHQDLLQPWYKLMGEQIGMEADKLEQVFTGAVKYGREAVNHLIADYPPISTAINQSAGPILNATKTVKEGLEDIDRNIRKTTQK